MSQPITAGQEVTYQGEPYVVRSIDGNVIALEYHTGGFFRFVHMASVAACSPSAIQTAATSLDAPAAGQGESIHARFRKWLQADELRGFAIQAGLLLLNFVNALVVVFWRWQA